MPRKAAAAEEPPKTLSEKLAKERHKEALVQAKTQKLLSPGLFGDISVPMFPPDPVKEEPVPDEPLSAEDIEIERAYQESAGPALPEDVAALDVYAGAEEEPSAAEALEASERALEEAEERIQAAAAEETVRREDSAFMGIAERIAAAEAKERGFVDEHLKPAAERTAEALTQALELPEGQRVEFDTEPLGPDSFGGSDEESHYMAQTRAERLVEPARAEEAPETDSAEGLTSPAADASVAGASSAPAGNFALFGTNMFGDEIKAKTTGPLSKRFKLPPFTVFDARQGIWQDRKRAWLGLGIQSEVGRGDNLLKMSDTVMEPDPVKRAEMVAAREKKRKHAFGQEFVLGAQPGVDGKPGGQGKAWHTNDTGLSRKLAPGGGGGGAWLGGPKTGSSEKYGRENESDVVTDEEGNPLASKTGTSIFDPVLTELLYSWFCPPAGRIFDPFAGGSVRGIVAAKLGRQYCGIELRGEQIAANEKQAAKICVGDDFQPLWIEGDSTNAEALTDGALFDFVIACPPYGDLEVYSEDPRDLSNMTWEDFAAGYTKIIAEALKRLKDDRFAYFVIGDIRDEDGNYRGLPELTVRAFEEAGARKYNEAVLLTAVGSLPIRIGKQFNSGRKLGKTHQNVLGFVKGDPRKAAEACGGQLDFAL